MTTVQEKCGGFKTVGRIDMSFFQKALDSGRIGGRFDDAEMPRLIDDQTKFVTSLMGGPTSRSGWNTRCRRSGL